MSQRDSNVTFTTVAFRYDQKRSVLYISANDIERVKELVAHALEKLDADVISIRRVYTKNPLET